MDNVINLQSKKEEKQQKKFDEILEKFTSHEKYIDEISGLVVNEVIQVLDENNLDIESQPESIKDILILIDVLRSLIHRIEGTPYPLHEYSDQIFEQSGQKDCAKLMNEFLYGDEKNS